MAEQVLVVDKEVFKKLGLLDAKYTPVTDEVHLKLLTGLAKRRLMDREKAEHDNGSLQIIPYVTVFAGSRTVLAYRRCGSESRLSNYYSLGFGGHVSTEDHGCVKCALERELAEELGIAALHRNAKLVGVIYDDSVEVSSVHLGLHYVYALLGTENIKLSEEVCELVKVHIDELGKYNLENWSRICLENRQYWQDVFSEVYEQYQRSIELIRRALEHMNG